MGTNQITKNTTKSIDFAESIFGSIQLKTRSESGFGSRISQINLN